MRIACLVLLFLLASPKARSACTSPAGVAGTMDYFSGDNEFKYCDGTNWVTLGSAATTSATYEGWPDVIICDVTNPVWGNTAFKLSYMPFTGDGLVYYEVVTNNSAFYVRFNNTTKAWVSYGSSLVATSNCNVPISTLISNGQAKFFGNDISAVNSDDDGDTKIYTEQSADEDRIRFDTAGTERMIIDDIGQVGIGVTSPSANFHLTAGRGGNQGIRLTSSTDSNNIRAKIRNSSPNDHGMLELYDNTETATVSIRSSGISYISGGDLGVGTTTPGARLEVSGGTTILQQEGWINVSSFTNGWSVATTYSSPTVDYYKDSTGRVWLRGCVLGGTASSSAFTLPVGYRPTTNRTGASTAWNSGGDANVARIRVMATGNVTVYQQSNQDTTTHMCFDGISFATH